VYNTRGGERFPRRTATAYQTLCGTVGRGDSKDLRRGSDYGENHRRKRKRAGNGKCVRSLKNKLPEVRCGGRLDITNRLRGQFRRRKKKERRSEHQTSYTGFLLEWVMIPKCEIPDRAGRGRRLWGEQLPHGGGLYT